MTPYKQPKVSILEGKWFPNKDVSVRDLIRALLDVWNPEYERAYHYEVFTTEEAFCSAISHAFEPGNARLIYIAAHGDKGAIYGFHDDGITRAKIRHALQNATQGVVKRGLYFGSCLFGSLDNAEFVLTECSGVEWIAGYTTAVDWIDSTVVDLFFLRHYLFPAPGKGNSAPNTVRKRVVHACKMVATNMPSLARRLEFHVYLRKKGPGGYIDDQMDRIYHPKVPAACQECAHKPALSATFA